MKNCKASFTHFDTLYPIKHLYLEVTSRCNLSCPQCSVLSRKPKAQDPDVDLLRVLLSDFYNIGGRYLTISGGEPGLRADLPAIISKATNLGIDVTVYTNGTAVTQEVLECVKDASGILAVSIDGPNADIHEQMRGKGSFAFAVSRLEKAIEFLGGRHVMLSSILSKPLLSHIEKFVDFVRSYPISVLYMGLFEPLVDYTIHDHAPNAQELIPAVLYLLDSLNREEDPQLLFSESYDLIKLNSPFSIRKQEKIVGSTVKVQADGWAYPGPFFYDSGFRLGRPMEQGWAAVQQSDVYAELLTRARERIDKVKECSQCFWSGRCGGGSLALTWASYGRWDEVCPLCKLYKATLERAARIFLKNESNTLSQKKGHQASQRV